jgi:hypothetical protein
MTEGATQIHFTVLRFGKDSDQGQQPGEGA